VFDVVKSLLLLFETVKSIKTIVIPKVLKFIVAITRIHMLV